MAIYTDTHDRTENEEPTGRQEAKLSTALWVFFSSMRTAIVLLLLLATVSVVGTVIQQNALPEEYTRIYGPGKYAILRTLGFTNVYQSGWYKCLLALIGINLLVCSINRLGSVWRQTLRPKVSIPSASIARMPRTETMSVAGSVEDAADKVKTALRAGSYRVVEQRDGGDVAIHASKGSLSLWGPYLTHLSILVIFIGAVFGSLFGFEGYASIAEGQSITTYERSGAHAQANLGFRVALDNFRIAHDRDHNPTQYKSDLRVYQGSREVARKVIDVNHPLTYRGVSFHQSDYGLSGLVLKVTAPSGESKLVPFDMDTGFGPQGKEFTVAGEPFKQVTVAGRKFTVFAHDFVPDFAGDAEMSGGPLPLNPAVKVMANDRFPAYKGLDAWANLGWLSASNSAKYKGFTITLDHAVNYTGLQVSQNPGLPVIYAGFLLLLIGVFLSFYVTRMVIRVRVSPTENAATLVIGAMSRGEMTAFDPDFARLRSALT